MLHVGQYTRHQAWRQKLQAEQTRIPQAPTLPTRSTNSRKQTPTKVSRVSKILTSMSSYFQSERRCSFGARIPCYVVAIGLQVLKIPFAFLRNFFWRLPRARIFNVDKIVLDPLARDLIALMALLIACNDSRLLAFTNKSCPERYQTFFESLEFMANIVGGTYQDDNDLHAPNPVGQMWDDLWSVRIADGKDKPI